jgi:hypothetical protein
MAMVQRAQVRAGKMALTVLCWFALAGFTDTPPAEPTSPPSLPEIGSSATTPDAFMASIFSSGTPRVMSARGDLNGDGIEDWAAVLQWVGKHGEEAQLIILTGRPTGGFALAEHSQPTQLYRYGIDDIRIEHGSLFLKTDHPGSATSHSGSIFHIKYYQGDWRLIGCNLFDAEVGASTMTHQSYNYLTGRSVSEKLNERGKVVSSTTGHIDTAAQLLRDIDLMGAPPRNVGAD